MSNHLSFSLNKLGIQALNDLQLATVEASKNYADLIVYAPTGSGKTLAFLLSVLQKMDLNTSSPQVLIISPTRELVLQIEDVFKKLSTSYKVNAFYGGHSIKIEENNFSTAPAVIVATPGRLADHIRRNNLNLNTIHTLVLDEFDKSLEMGFEDDMQAILEEMPSLKHKILTSATQLEAIPDFTALNKPHTINFCTGDKINLNYYSIQKTQKEKDIFHLLCSFDGEKSIVFCNYRESVLELCSYLSDEGLIVTQYHGGMEQDERERALIRFRNGSSNILISTSLASRGLDIPDVEHIVHFELPDNETDFTQRNGRTARQNKAGNCYFFQETKASFLPNSKTINPLDAFVFPKPPKWKTIYISAGKKDKVNKVDIVGFLHKVGHLSKENIGLIFVLDNSSFVAIESKTAERVVPLLRNQKIKGKKQKIGFAR